LDRPRRAAANVQINGHDTRDAADHRVAVGKNAPVDHAVADRNQAAQMATVAKALGLKTAN